MAVPAIRPETEVPAEWTSVQLAAARLFAAGKSRSTVATKLEFYLLTPVQHRLPPMRRRYHAMKRLRRWQQKKDFRDLVWALTVERLDQQTPEIVQGVANRGKAGRVDAAKLGLELAGRYTPKAMDQPTAVQIVVNSVPRPTVQAVGADTVAGQLLDEEEA